MVGVTIASKVGDSEELGNVRPDWETRLARIVAMMREMSTHTDPQEMVRAYGARVREFMPIDRMVALSRRDLPRPKYRITRSSTWDNDVNPWAHKSKLPVLEGGLLGKLIYGEEPVLIDDLVLDPHDPSYPYLEGVRSLLAMPHYDQGVAANMVVLGRSQPGAFPREEYPEWVWQSSLFGRATHNLVLSRELKQAYEVVERELRIVADLQRTLLPKKLPSIPGVSMAVHYQTSRWAGGDYYDIFALPDGRFGLLIADVSGHGTPAAIMMAVTHSIAHTYPGAPERPGHLLSFINEHLAARYTNEFEAFVTAFFGIYDPVLRTLTYASAGHNPPRLKRCEDGSVIALDGVGNLPLGIATGSRYDETTLALRSGDQVVFYTDGITEATAPDGQTMFGPERLDQAIANCFLDAEGLVEAVVHSVEDFTAGAPPSDDRTLLVAKIA
jgi:sigma-B regulation protein RsbU (phosphoserine phosphatase)